MSRVKTKHEQVAAVEARLLKRLRAVGSIPRVELARELNFAPSTIGIYVDRLIEEGFLREGDRAAAEKGRPATLLTLNPAGGRFVGIDVEARVVLATAVDFSQQPIKNVGRRLRVNESADSVFATIKNVIGEVTAGDDRPILGIGIGVPGAVDAAAGMAKHYSYIRGWKDLPLRQLIADSFQVPVYLENNVRSMALAELWFGQGRNVNHFICLGIRSGIAAGFVLNGELHRGADNLAGEIGAWPVRTERTSHNAPGWERLEDVASIRALGEHMNLAAPELGKATKPGPASSPLAPYVKAAEENHPAIREELLKATDALGMVVCQLCLAFNPRKLIITGPLTEFGSLALDPLVDAVRRLAPPLHSAIPEIVNSTMGEYAGALGAAALAVHEWKPAR